MVHGLPGSKRMKLSLTMWLDEDLSVPSTVTCGMSSLGYTGGGLEATMVLTSSG